MGRILDGRAIGCPDETVGGMIRSLGSVVLLLVAALLIVQFTADFLEATGTPSMIHRVDLGLVVIGFCTAIAGLLILMLDAAAWGDQRAVAKHIVRDAFRPPSGRALQRLVGLEGQPLDTTGVVLMMGVGALLALFGSVLLSDDPAD